MKVCNTNSTASILSKDETTSMRGIAIIFIVLHNLLHLLLPTVENEFTFKLERSVTFAKYALEFNPSLWKDIFSFLGWYGVVVFLFLSGYGLTKKYGYTQEKPFNVGTFVWKHLKRVLLLMIIPYTLFVIIKFKELGTYRILLQLTLTSNIFGPNGINPGVYWFFGLIAQFYILFAIIRYIKDVRYRSIILLSISALSIIFMFCIPGDSALINYIRHNCIGWLLPFSMGVWFAEQQSLDKLFNSLWKNVAWVISCGLLVVISNANYYTWCISPIFAIMASIALTKILSRCCWIDKGCIWFGALSSFLFAVHPIVRCICLKYITENMTRTLYILGYLLASVALALLYRAIHKRFLS